MPRPPRPAARAERLEGPVPDTLIAPGLAALCHSGERAVTVATRPGHDPVAALGSPFDPEAFLTWRTEGIQIFFRGPTPARLELAFDATARVAASVTYDEEPTVSQTPETVETIDFEVDGTAFTLRVSESPSGLRGLVFSGDEKVAGVQVYHRSDRAALVSTARSDKAVLRFAAQAGP